MAILRYGQQRAQARFGAVLVPLFAALGSCGGTSTSHQRQGSGDVATAAAGRSSAASGGVAANGAGHAGRDGGHAGDDSSHAGNGGAGAGGAGIDSAPAGGEAGDPSFAGAGGAQSCVDVCELYGEACCTNSVSCVSADASCVIQVFDAPGTTIEHDYPALEQLVASLPEIFRASVSTADIVSSAAEPFPASRIELHLSAQASSAYGMALEGAQMRPFRIACAGQGLFVGQVYRLEGAAGIATPVLHVSRDADDTIVLRLGAWQGAWLFSGATGDVAARARLDRSELRSTLCLGGAPQPL